MVGFPQAQIVDITGPMEILARARLPDRRPAYQVELIAEVAGPLTTTSGLSLIATRSLRDISDAELAGLDMLLISGGDGVDAQLTNDALLTFIKRAAIPARRVASVCSGSLLLAAAGLLDGRRAATHWTAIDWFRKTFPAVDVDGDAIYVRDGKFWSSAGITTGMDMALALIEEDLGRQAALGIARRMVMFLMRPGGQSQFSSQLAAQGVEDERIARVCRFIAENPAAPLTVPQLADTAGMSARNFARRFAEETGVTPAQFVERSRLDAACQMLAVQERSLERISREAGFGASERMRRSFLRHLGITPNRYRERFSTAQRDSAQPPHPPTQKEGNHVEH
ncbi:MAG: helix-turn-helix domain-containing protein [Rhizobiales bacterium]|nr:helix-turn-helix domain-containing protein [Hyphomicrobiales bacterium]